MSIPLSKDFNIQSNVIAPAGNAIDANGLMLTNSAAVEQGVIRYFFSAREVADLFGFDSEEHNAAKIYFGGYEGSAVKPGKLLCVGIKEGFASGTLISGSNEGVSINKIKTAPISSITLYVNGKIQVSEPIDLTKVGAQSDVAQAIESSLTDVTVTFDPNSSRYTLRSDIPGKNSSVSFASGQIADMLMLTQAKGAIINQGNDPMNMYSVMNSVIDRDQNWVAFACANELSDNEKFYLAAWAQDQENGTRFLYCFNDSNPAITVPGAESTILETINQSNLAGVFPIYGTPRYAFTALAYIASLDFSALNGRITYKFRKFPGLVPSISRLSEAKALESNGYSYYGDYQQTINQYSYVADGSVTGPFKWMDTFVDQVWIRMKLIEAFATTFAANQSFPFNAQGKAGVSAPVIGVAEAGLNYGAIQRGVLLDESQRSQIINKVGKDVTPQLFANGWYFHIPAQPGENRLERALKSAIFLWCDGQMIQSISMQSTTVL